ncbi:agmatine deiminase. putative [Heliomicrobium modesticaldum Ice1]|uniref:Putative agmatine deiminase n=1 Tax=Heliobacterium modesticaldum (strain ATCC 51547 / Ice1) TaxID=498761 RepID=B0THU4_HELMI|nr:agmatine deiminase [Heliomicrobium modesticaldum]ABZ84877.1 agmatine deiminase. putative [Heliomicrobium modesticaldum Ice1]
MSLPQASGFAMPPEWAPHQRTFIVWPIDDTTWPDELDEVRQAYARVAQAIARFEPVTMVVLPELVEEAARICGPSVDILPMEYDDSWIRDSGPTFLKNAAGELAGVNWQFNAWGNKFPSELDNLVAPQLLDHFGIRRFDAPFVLEGGSIHVDGEGTLLTTEECLLNKNRNPHMTREELDAQVRQYLGVEKIIWLKKGLCGDHTDGHVDNVACFARPGVVLLQVCSDPEDPNYAISRENLEILRQAVDAKGRSLEIIPIEQPPALYHKGVRMAASYINFYFVNGGIILPIFGGECAETDRQAEAILARVFPDRTIVPIESRIILTGGGNIHCATQQMPK